MPIVKRKRRKSTLRKVLIINNNNSLITLYAIIICATSIHGYKVIGEIFQQHHFIQRISNGIVTFLATLQITANHHFKLWILLSTRKVRIVYMYVPTDCESRPVPETKKSYGNTISSGIFPTKERILIEEKT